MKNYAKSAFQKRIRISEAKLGFIRDIMENSGFRTLAGTLDAILNLHKRHAKKLKLGKKEKKT